MSTTADEAPALRSSAVMAAGTAVSRVLGFVRNIVLVWAIGSALLGDTYFVANTLPNIIYILLAGGALNAVFVPQLVRAAKDPDGGARFTDTLLTVALLLLVGVTVVATLSAPLLIRLYTQGWDGPELSVGTAFGYWCLPQIFFYGLFTLLGQVLNARGVFGPMMWTPIVNNLVVITTALVFLAVMDVDRQDPASISPAGVALLGAGATLGIVAQALALVPFLRRAGYRYRPRLRLRGSGLRRTGTLAGWTLLFVAVNQLGYVVVTRVATGAAKAAELLDLDVGVGITPYQNAYLIFLLPHSIATVSIVTALLPRMSRAAADGRVADLRADISSGLRTTAVATIFATAAFLVLGRHMTTVMYSGDGLEDGRYIGWVLTAFAPGLVLFSAQHLVLRGFYAREDTRTPFLVQCAIVALNVAAVITAAAVLPAQWRTVGMAAGYSAAYAVGLGLSTALLRRRVGSLDGRRVIRTHVRLLLAALVAGALAWAVAAAVTYAVASALLASLLATVAGLAVLLVGYVVVARRLRVTELDAILSAVRGKLGR